MKSILNMLKNMEKKITYFTPFLIYTFSHLECPLYSKINKFCMNSRQYYLCYNIYMKKYKHSKKICAKKQRRTIKRMRGGFFF